MKTRLSALLLALLLLLPISGAFAAGGASAAENGSIAVRFAGLEGAAFRLYRVADVLPGGEFALSGDFAAYPVALDAPDAAAWRALAQTLAGYAARDGRPAFIEVQLLRDGRVFDTVRLREENNWSHTWTGLDADFAWSVVETAVPAGYTVRVERAGITFVLTNTRPEPEEPEEPETPGGKLPQTGSLWWPVPVLALAGLFLLLLGWGRRRADRGA